MKTVIWLCWTLISGEAKDVDAFISQEACLSFYTQSEQNRQRAISQHPNAALYSYTTCTPLEVTGPGKPNV